MVDINEIITKARSMSTEELQEELARLREDRRKNVRSATKKAPKKRTEAQVRKQKQLDLMESQMGTSDEDFDL